jgi:hypothetical protein
MIKVPAPQDHNWTHLRYPRTLWEAFQGKGDMHLSAPTRACVEPGVLALFVLQWVTVLFFSFVAFYLVAYV